MDDAVLRALQQWPNVPACYGWLHLDARGRWLLGLDGGELVRHAGLRNFLARNYSCNDHSEWFVQNGPQRAYVCIARTPYVLHLDGEGRLITHTEQTVRKLTNALFGRDGNLYLQSEFGLSLVDDRDLPKLLEKIGNADGHSPDEINLLALIQGREAEPLFLRVGETTLPCNYLNTDKALGPAFGFVEEPTLAQSVELDQK